MGPAMEMWLSCYLMGPSDTCYMLVKYVISAWGDGLSLIWCQASIKTNADILLNLLLIPNLDKNE